MNGRRIGKIAEFFQMPDGGLACRPAELAEIGIAAPAGVDPIPLSKLAGVTARYDAPSQTVAIAVAAESTTVRRLGEREATPRPDIPARADWGVAANYVFFAGASQAIGGNWSRRFDGASLTLDGRFFSPHGTLSQSAILGTTTGTSAGAVRLATTFTRVDEERSLMWRAGDVVSGGLAWTRPVRLGGVQVQRNFSLRSDLVMLPLPALSGTAAVPSTVDVWINDQKVRSIGEVEGRFEVADIPLVTGSGEARLVVRDATGRAVENRSSFYVSPRMLRGGLWDFSLEAGAPRTGYGVDGGRYHVDETFLSWTLRDGLTDW
ncbi:MAG: fimbrial biogenesis outer membrane usher protein, partial [Siculibacillus sp.]|nr:fimbrial biogenesis outer membrane usher protein [Siculibacillus sp.]